MGILAAKRGTQVQSTGVFVVAIKGQETRHAGPILALIAERAGVAIFAEIKVGRVDAAQVDVAAGVGAGVAVIATSSLTSAGPICTGSLGQTGIFLATTRAIFRETEGEGVGLGRTPNASIEECCLALGVAHIVDEAVAGRDLGSTSTVTIAQIYRTRTSIIAWIGRTSTDPAGAQVLEGTRNAVITVLPFGTKLWRFRGIEFIGVWEIEDRTLVNGIELIRVACIAHPIVRGRIQQRKNIQWITGRAATAAISSEQKDADHPEPVHSTSPLSTV
jgi:hypothetical protein